MVPHTYPTIEGRLVLGVITDITGLNEWQDYIPVVAQTSPVASSRNTFANDGYMGVNVLSSLTGLNAWIDYIPCYVVTGRSSPFSVSPDGYISVSAEVGTLGGASLADYIINSKTPDLVADFNGSLNTGTEFYDAGGTADTFAELITHSRAGNATMTDGYGPELVTNGGFTSDSDWTSFSGALLTFADSQLTVSLTGTDTFGSATQQITTVAGKTYFYSVLAYVNSGTFEVDIATTEGGSNIVNGLAQSSGPITGFFTATGSTTYINLGVRTANASTRFSSVSVREIPAIKWAPHNLLAYSEDFTNAAWTKNNCTESSGLLTATGSTSYIKSTISSTQHIQTFEAVVSSGTSAFPYILLLPRSATDVSNQGGAYFNLTTGTVHSTEGTAISADIVALDSGEYRISLKADTSASTSVQIEARLGFGNVAGSQTTIIGNTLNVSKTNLYRSDLGGMVDNPNRGDSYVPTTSSAVYLPRRNHHVYNGDAWVNEGVLHESEARTNLFTNSNSLATATNITATLNNTVSPDGKINGTLLSNQGGNWHYYHSPISLIQNTQYTLSCYAKYKAGSGFVWLLCEVSGDAFVMFDILNGVAVNLGTGSQQASSSSIEDAGNGWYRISATFTKTSAGGPLESIGIGVSPTSTQPNWDGTGLADTEQAYVYGFQLEEGSTPSSYIPTNSATVSRALETLTIPAANMPWPEPNVIGPELVVNGTFDSDLSGWTAGASWSWSDGKAEDSGTTGWELNQTLTTEVGKVYSVSLDVSDLSGGTPVITVASPSNIIKTITADGRQEAIFVAVGVTSLLSIYGANALYKVDNVSVREIDPLSVSIQMQGRMTYADENEVTGVSFYDWSIDPNNNIMSGIRTSNTPINWRVSQAVNGTFDSVVQSPADYQPGVFVPFNFAGRHGSTFINGAVDGVALTANTTPLALPDLSATDFNLGYDYMGTISMLRVWADDLADVGIVEATEPSEVPSLQLTFDNSQTSFTVQDWEQ